MIVSEYNLYMDTESRYKYNTVCLEISASQTFCVGKLILQSTHTHHNMKLQYSNNSMVKQNVRNEFYEFYVL